MLAVVLMCLMQSAHSGVPIVPSVADGSAVATGVDVKKAIDDKNKVAFSLQALGVKNPIRLVGADVNASVDFSFNTVRIVQRLRLKLHYSYSPLLNPESSYLKVSLNGKEVNSFPLSKEAANDAKVVLEIDPVLLQEWNHLNLEFVSHLDQPFCDNPRSKKLWLQVDNVETLIEANAATLPVAKDLSLLPLQIFDKHDMHDMSIPFVFASQPAWEKLKSAGIMASWLGSMADWRTVHFPSHINAIPNHNAIVLATVGENISGVTLPEVTNGLGVVKIIANPRNPEAYLLLVVGKDNKALVEVAKALVLTKKLPVGELWNVKSVNSSKRLPFDAPAWLPVDQTIRLDAIVRPEALQAKGLFVRPYEMVLHLPPDLHRSPATTVPFNFLFASSNNDRYLRRIDAYINGHAFQFERFDKPEERLNGLLKGKVRLDIPTRRLTGKDTITVQFTFVDKELKSCDTVFVKDEVRIDPGSTIDLAGLPQYVELPDLSYLAYTGYPYSKVADLSETAVLLPDMPDHFEIDSMLTLLGHIGNKTGYPATAVTVESIRNADKFANKDMLIIGSIARVRPLLDSWKSHLQVNLLSDSQPFPQIGNGFFNRLRHWTEQSVLFNKLKGEPSMVLLGFESPLKSKRSVVMFTAKDTTSLVKEVSLLNTLDKAKDFNGDVVVIADEGTYDTLFSFNWARKYSNGKLSVLDWFRDNKAHNPWLAALVAIVMTLLFASLAYHKFRNKADRKLGKVMP